MLFDLFTFFKRTILPGEFERSVFIVVSRHVTDKRGLGEELAGIENLNKLPPNDEKRQRMAAELYLLLERNISEEQMRNRVPREALREKIFNQCHPERTTSNFGLLFIPHYERQIKLFERFTNITLGRASEIMTAEEYADFMKFLSPEIMHGAIKNNTILWNRLEKQASQFTPPVRRDMMENTLKHAFDALIRRLEAKLGETRVELLLEEIYKKYHEPIGFVEDSAKVLVMIPDNYLEDERIGLLGKEELEIKLRQKSKALETTLAEVQGERLKLSELSREELEKKVRERTAELVNALKAAEEARKNLEEFSSLATHELRTPIASMKGYLNLVSTDKTGKLTESQRKYLGDVTHANDRLLTLVNAMLDVARIELGTLAVEPMSVSISGVTDDVLAELAAKIKENGQAVVKNYDPAVPMMALDPNLMHAVLINLVSNSVKYTGEKGKITIATKKRESDVLISITDTGYGIPKAQHSQIFEKMFRADNARIKVPEGTGLGLYLVKSIIEQTGGKVWFESEEGKGSTFFVAIPLSGMKRRQGSKGLS